MWRKLLSLGLVFGLLCGPLSALPSQGSPSSDQSGSGTLSADEYAAIEGALLQAQEALKKSQETIAQQSQLLTQAEQNLQASNQLIQTQSKTLTWLWIFSGALAAAVTIDAIADLVKK